MKARALIIEDRPEVTELFRRALEKLDLEIFTAASLVCAEPYLKQQPPPDLVLLDLNLNEKEVAAYTITKIPWIKEFNPDMMLLVVSGFLTPELVEAALTKGAALAIGKLDLQKQVDLWRAIEACLSKVPVAARERLAHPVELLRQFATKLSLLLII